MKKLICIVLALLFVCGAAFAEAPKSVTVNDLVKETVSTWVKGAGLPTDGSFFLKVLDETMLDEELENYQDLKNTWETEVVKLASCGGDFASFFLPLTGADGQTIDLNEMIKNLTGTELGWNKTSVYEFWPIVAGGYDVGYGDVTAMMSFMTPYAEGQKVIVLIGIVDVRGELTEDADKATFDTYTAWYDQEVDWVAFEGTGVKEYIEGEEEPVVCIEVTFTPEMVDIIQKQPTLLAILSDEMTLTETGAAAE